MGSLNGFLGEFRDEVDMASVGSLEAIGFQLQVEWKGNKPQIMADALLKDTRTGLTRLVAIEMTGPPSAWAVTGAKDAIEKASRLENAA